MKNLLFIVLLLCCSFGFGQNDSLRKAEKDSIRAAKKAIKESRWWSFAGYPVFFYTPETEFGFGAFVSYTFSASKGKNPNEKRSQFQVGGAYTTLNQILLWTPFKIFWGGDKNYFFGEFGYFKFSYSYWGIGNNTAESNEEVYDVAFPRIRPHYTRQIKESPVSIGGAWWFENYKLSDIEENGVLDQSFGSQGGNTSGVGPVMVLDTRDNVIYPQKGFYVESKIYAFRNWLGSDYNFYKGYIDASHYWKPHKKGVWATNLNFRYSGGDVPFNMMSLIGGTKRMRGYYEGRYRDHNALILQGEYRLDLPWRFGMVAFADIAQTYRKTAWLQIGDWRWTVGGGIRFALDYVRKINLRLDYGVGPDTQGFYITVGEAF